jgi:hypothetical protein
VKFSRRQRRYRRRFLTLTRTFLPHLRRLEQPQQVDPESFSSWEILCHGLCLKSAQEVAASPDGIRRAIQEHGETFGIQFSPCSHRD